MCWFKSSDVAYTSTIDRQMKIIDKLKFAYNVRTLPRDKPQVYVIDELAVAYIQIPKVASRSIRTALTRYLVGDAGAEEDDAALVDRFENRFSSHMDHSRIADLSKRYFIFAIVRNPYDRIVSCYKNKVVNNQKTERAYIFEKYGLVRGASLEDFVTFVCNVPDKYADRHFRSQAWFLSWQGKLLPSYVGRLENLVYDWEEIYSRSGIKAPPVLNSTKNQAALSLSPALKERIYARYRDDFTLFGYEK